MNLEENLTNIQFNTSFYKLINNAKDLSFTISHYCCPQVKNRPCWQDAYGVGLWDMDLNTVKKYCIDELRTCSKYLYNRKKYGLRFFKGTYNTNLHLYCRVKDKLKYDLDIIIA